jgi:hypothetical protein
MKEITKDQILILEQKIEELSKNIEDDPSINHIGLYEFLDEDEEECVSIEVNTWKTFSADDESKRYFALKAIEDDLKEFGVALEDNWNGLYSHSFKIKN